MFTAINRRRLNQVTPSLNLIHSVNVFVHALLRACVCVCVILEVEGKHTADAADFFFLPQKRESGGMGGLRG